MVTGEQGFLPYTPEEKSLLDFHYSNLEFACGAELSQVSRSHPHTITPSHPLQVSSLHWDHNDTFAQFSGPHAILPTGYHSILTGMAQGLDIDYNTPVKTIAVEGEGVRVGDEQGRMYEADKVWKLTIIVVWSVNHCGTYCEPLW